MGEEMMFDKVDELQRRLQLLRQSKQIHPDTSDSLREKMILDWTYHSNAMEGNTLIEVCQWWLAIMCLHSLRKYLFKWSS